MVTLRTLPKVRDRISFLYFEHCRVEQELKAIAVFREQEKYIIPCASLSTLLLGPGTSITHAAIKTLADNACAVQWVGEDCLRFYVAGKGSSNKTDRLLHQVKLWADSLQRLSVVRRMYEYRFDEPLPEDLTLEQIRGREGARVRTAYSRLSKETGVEWKGRSYKRENWDDADAINRALSIANACLYGVCQAAINSVGYCSALGFIHTGNPLSFIHDVSDLYKAETTIPAAFEAVAETYFDLDSVVRRKCREKFSQHRLMQRLIHDVDQVLQFKKSDEDGLAVSHLWDDQINWVEGGKNWSEV